MNTPDVDTALRALEDARRILEQYINPGPRDPEGTLERDHHAARESGNRRPRCRTRGDGPRHVPRLAAQGF